MARKQVRTFHPLAVAASLSAQNDAVGLLIQKAIVTGGLADNMNVEAAKAALRELRDEAEKLRAILWPDEDE